MTANGPVDVKKQTIHAIIPGLDGRAAKKIDKLKIKTTFNNWVFNCNWSGIWRIWDTIFL